MSYSLGALLGGGLGTQDVFIRARLPWVEVEAREGLDVNLDGEPLEGSKLRFEVRPAALSMHLPADSPLLSSTGRLGLPEG